MVRKFHFRSPKCHWLVLMLIIIRFMINMCFHVFSNFATSIASMSQHCTLQTASVNHHSIDGGNTEWVSENISEKSVWTNFNFCHITVENSTEAVDLQEEKKSPVFACTCGITRIDTHNLTNFTNTTFSLSLSSPSSLHPSSARPELGERKTEKRQSEKKREIRFPFHVGSLEWSLKPQSVLALDKEAGFNKYVD